MCSGSRPITQTSPGVLRWSLILRQSGYVRYRSTIKYMENAERADVSVLTLYSSWATSETCTLRTMV